MNIKAYDKLFVAKTSVYNLYERDDIFVLIEKITYGFSTYYYMMPIFSNRKSEPVCVALSDISMSFSTIKGYYKQQDENIIKLI